MSVLRAIGKSLRAAKYASLFISVFFSVQIVQQVKPVQIPSLLLNNGLILFLVIGFLYLLIASILYTVSLLFNKPCTPTIFKLIYVIVKKIIEGLGTSGCAILSAYTAKELELDETSVIIMAYAVIALFFTFLSVTFLRDFGLLDICICWLLGQIWVKEIVSDLFHLSDSGTQSVLSAFIALILGLRVVLLPLFIFVDNWAWHHKEEKLWVHICDSLAYKKQENVVVYTPHGGFGTHHTWWSVGCDFLRQLWVEVRGGGGGGDMAHPQASDIENQITRSTAKPSPSIYTDDSSQKNRDINLHS